jgi:carboxyl-terminal processing protease
MRHLKLDNLGPIALATGFCFLIAAGCVTTRKTPPPSPTTAQTPARLRPGPNDGHIAYWTARFLEDYHYSQEPLDTAKSEEFFDEYVESLDPRHENFLQSDLAEFAQYRTNLDTLTLGRHDTADLTPAYVIYQRLVDRLEQHVAYADQLLQQDKFKFNTDEHILIDRSHAPYPKDLDEARQLWRQRLRYEYLQEKLSREISRTNENVIVSLPKSAAEEISATLARHYRWNLQMVTNWDSDNILQAYLNALTHAYDPHSDYLNNQHAQDFSIGMSLSLFGIGATLTEDDGYCTINSLVRGGPAYKCMQLKERDRIIAVAQSNQPPVNVVDMELAKVVHLIRGPKGTEVRLTISPADDRTARREVTLVRDEIKLADQEAKAQLISLPDGHGGTNRIGVLDLPSFYVTLDLAGNSGHAARSITADVSRLVKKLQQEKVAGLVLDLRNNPGGSLEEAIKFTGLFIKDGPVVLARNSDGRVAVDSDNDPDVLYDGPLVLLVNRFSASASEIVAAALQDYGRAVIVGDTSTFGKGTVQNLNPLRPFIWPASPSATNDPGTLKVTIRKFYRVTGASTQWRGVMPDIILPDTLSYRTDAASERTLDHALPADTLPADTIRRVHFDKLNLVQPYLDLLRERSDSRVAANQEFTYIRQDIAELKKSRQDQQLAAVSERVPGTIGVPSAAGGPELSTAATEVVTPDDDAVATLNERDAIKERERLAARQKSREAERATRKAPDEKVYEITVENCDEPGLPSPRGVTNAAAATSPTNTATAAAASTNSVTTTAAESAPPPIDPLLTETKNILEDYIALLSKSNILIANQPGR